MALTINQLKVITDSKTSIARDVFIGFLTSIGIGLLASLLFVLIVLFLSSNALAACPHAAGAFYFTTTNNSSQDVIFIKTEHTRVYKIAPLVDTAVTIDRSSMVDVHKVQTILSTTNNITIFTFLNCWGCSTDADHSGKLVKRLRSIPKIGLSHKMTPRFVPDSSTVPNLISSPERGAVDVFNSLAQIAAPKQQGGFYGAESLGDGDRV